MPFKYNRSVTYDEFESRVRRHRWTDVLNAIGQLTAEQVERQIDLTQDRLLLPWALASICKEAIRFGTEYRTEGVTQRDLQELAAAYNALADPLTAGTASPEDLHAFFVRVSYEQFPYQMSLFSEITRPVALFSLDVKTSVISEEFWDGMLGCSLIQFLSAAFILTVAAEKSGGWFDFAWLDGETYRPILEVVDKTTVLEVAQRALSLSPEGFRESANAYRSTDPLLRRFDYNPLVADPFVRLQECRMLAPVAQLLTRPLSVEGLYYAGLEYLGDEAEKGRFTQDIGHLFEAYVGVQLQHFPNAEVMPEIVYDKDHKRSVDWIVVWDDLVLLVEAKATRLGLQARMGTEQLLVDLDRTLGKAIRQIAVSSDRIRDEHPSFAAVPHDRPIMGLVVTLEPYFHVNSSQARAFLPDPAIPTIACSARELEQLVQVGRVESASQLLQTIAADAQRYNFDLTASLGDRTVEHNPVLLEAWRRLPWTSRMAAP